MTSIALGDVVCDPIVLLSDGNLLHLRDVYQELSWSENPGEVALHLELVVKADTPTPFGELQEVLGNGAKLRLDCDWGDGPQTIGSFTVWHRWYRDTGMKTLEVSAYDDLIFLVKDDATLVLTSVPTAANQAIKQLFSLPQFSNKSWRLGQLSGPTAPVYQQLYRTMKGIDIVNTLLRWGFMRTPPDDTDAQPFYIQIRDGVLDLWQPAMNQELFVFDEQQSLSSIEEEESLDDLVTEVALVTVQPYTTSPDQPPNAVGFYPPVVVTIPDPNIKYDQIITKDVGQGWQSGPSVGTTAPTSTLQPLALGVGVDGRPLFYNTTNGNVQIRDGSFVLGVDSGVVTTQEVIASGRTEPKGAVGQLVDSGDPSIGWAVQFPGGAVIPLALYFLPVSTSTGSSNIDAFIQADVADLLQMADVQAVQATGLHVHREIAVDPDSYLGASAQAFNILQAQDRPWRTKRYDAPLCPPIRRGDAIYVRGGTVDGPLIVTGVEHDATNLLTHLTVDSAGILGQRISRQHYIGPFADEDDTAKSNMLNAQQQKGQNGTTGQPGNVQASFTGPLGPAGIFNPNAPAVIQTGDALASDWGCSAASSAWVLNALGIPATMDQVIANSAGYGPNTQHRTAATAGGPGSSDYYGITAHSGLEDGSGAQLAKELHTVYGVNATSQPGGAFSFASIAALAGHQPVMIGFNNFKGYPHWVAVRGVAPDGSLILMNPAPNLGPTLTAAQFGTFQPTGMITITPQGFSA